MSLYGSLFTGVSGLNAQGNAISMMADNIANMNTVGYKEVDASFSTLVSSSSSGGGSYSSGGVQTITRQLLDQQGILQGTGNSTDIGIGGAGFMVVNSKTDGKGDFLYTRAGSFKQDSNGNFVNASGYTLMAWPLDNQGLLPGQPGNATYPTSDSLLQSLEPVTSKKMTGSSTPTTTASVSLNLKASEKIIKGSGAKATFPVAAVTNYGLGATDIIGPDNSGANILNIGDQLILTPSNPGSAYTYTYGGLAVSNDITAGPGILGATNTVGVFSGATAGWQFTIDTPASGTVTYTYTPNGPVTGLGQFNNLSTLRDAINQTTGLSARITPDNKYLLVAPLDATKAMTFADVGAGTFVASLGLVSTVAAPNRFASLQGLSTIMNQSNGVVANVVSTSGGSALDFYALDPRGTLTIDALGSVGPPLSSAASVLSEFGINVVAGTAVGPAYDLTGASAPNLAGGTLTPDFVRSMRIYDALGTGHDLQVGFAKIDINTWAVELYVGNKADIVTSRSDGQVAAGTVVFNGDGTLSTVSQGLLAPINISWKDKAVPSSILFNWGTAGQLYGTPGATTIGKTDGLGQLDADYNVNFTEQNGMSPGSLSSITIDDLGFISANYSNGTSRNVFQIPIANFPNVNGLVNNGGNAYSSSTLSGAFNLYVANTGSVGKFSPGTLEQSNVELSDQLTKMIIAQKGYQAGSKIIKTVSEMLDDLNRSIT